MKTANSTDSLMSMLFPELELRSWISPKAEHVTGPSACNWKVTWSVVSQTLLSVSLLGIGKPHRPGGVLTVSM